MPINRTTHTTVHCSHCDTNTAQEPVVGWCHDQMGGERPMGWALGRARWLDVNGSWQQVDDLLCVECSAHFYREE